MVFYEFVFTFITASILVSQHPDPFPSIGTKRKGKKKTIVKGREKRKKVKERRGSKVEELLFLICIYNIYGFVIGAGIKMLETNIAGRGPGVLVRNRVRDQIVDKMCPAGR